MLIQCFGYAHLQTAQLSQAAQTADTGIAGIGFLLQVVNHLVTVVGTDGNGLAATLFQIKECSHHTVHVDVAFQMICFHKIAFAVALGAS